ncbi:MAG: hypothetical protein WBB44_11600 [Candidatus Nanopelagicales bacterium]
MHLLVTGKSGTLVHRAGGSETWVLEVIEPNPVGWESAGPTPKKGRIEPEQFVSLWQNGTVDSPALVNAAVKLNSDPNSKPLAVQVTALRFDNDVLEFTARPSAESTGDVLPNAARLRPVVLTIDADMVVCPIRFSPGPAGPEGKQLRSQAAKVAAQQSQVNAVTARNRNEYRAWVNRTGQNGTSYDEWRADTSTNGVTEAQLSRLEKSLNDAVTQLNKLSAQQNVALQRYVGNGARQTIENPDGKHYLALQQTGCLK